MGHIVNNHPQDRVIWSRTNGIMTKKIIAPGDSLEWFREDCLLSDLKLGMIFCPKTMDYILNSGVNL